MKDINQIFYDSLSFEYHLISTNWDKAVRDQGKLLSDHFIRQKFIGPQRVLDCSCGIGTQAIGLALMGHQVRATDLSEKSIERAKQEAERFGVQIELGTADFRTLAANNGSPSNLINK